MTDEIAAMRAIAHPVRLRILSLLTGTAMSAAEVARELGLTHANASYHLRLLADADELVVDGEEKIRGGVAKRYRYPHERDLEPSEPGAQRRPGAPSAYLRALGKELERRSRSRRPSTPGLSSDLEGWVDEETWEEVLELLMRASRLVHERNRPPRTEGTVHVSATALAFRMDDDVAAAEGADEADGGAGR